MLNEYFSDIMSLAFLRMALVGAILSACATSLLSVFVSLKKIAYMGEAFSHIAFAGVALALLIGTGINVTTMLFVAAVAIAIGIIAKRFSFEESNVTVIFLSVSMALGIILMKLNPRYTLDPADYLFGNVLLVEKADVISLGVILMVNLIFLIIYFKELFYICYNEEISKIFKIPVKRVYFLFILLLALNIIISVKIIGVILITAQLILPGSTALNLTRKIKRAVLLSVVLSVFAAFTGFAASYILEIPTGAVIVLVMFILFMLSLPVRYLRTR